MFQDVVKVSQFGERHPPSNCQTVYSVFIIGKYVGESTHAFYILTVKRKYLTPRVIDVYSSGLSDFSSITEITQASNHIRPKLVENTGSRPLPHRQAAKRRISSWVGDDQRIPGVVCSFCSLKHLNQ
jgi:hypothetical protein